MENEILATVHASKPRRAFGIGVLALLGGLLVYIALAEPPANIAWQVFLLGLGAMALWVAEKMRHATALTIELTEQELRCSDGTVIARVESIVSLDRGTFAFKPSNGFMLKLKEKAPGRFQPGLWWRLGRHVGVGGVTPGAQTKAMADMIAVMTTR